MRENISEHDYRPLNSFFWIILALILAIIIGGWINGILGLIVGVFLFFIFSNYLLKKEWK